MGVAGGPVAAVVAAGGEHLGVRLAEVEERLRALAGGPDAIASRAAATIAAGGKRLRPLLLLLCAGPAARSGDAVDELLTASAAVELVHAATLVHDDVLDAAALRRGHPTVWRRDGRAAATSAGDLLFGRAFGAVARAVRPAAVVELAAACRGLATGELRQREDAWRPDVTVARYLDRCALKTGRLFAAAARVGALVADEDPEPLGRFGDAIGVAFQLLDDVLDVTGPPERTGKPRGTDLLDGTATLPFLLAADRDRDLAGVDLRRLDVAGAAALCDRVEATGATRATEARAAALVRDAVDRLPADLDPQRDAGLRLIARGVVDRRL